MNSRSTQSGENTNPRAGVFLCRCGSSISSILDVEALAQEAAHMPGVAHVQVSTYSCVAQGLSSLKDAVRAHALNRVVVAGCTPRTHRKGFRELLREVGLHPGGFEMANLLEQCAKAHREGDSEAQENARDLLRMGVARSMAWKPSAVPRAPLARTAAVIGAGISGITASKDLAEHGFHVTLLERENEAGGLLAKLWTLYPSGHDPAVDIAKKVHDICSDSGIDLLTGVAIDRIVRTPSGFRLYLSSGGNGSQVIDASMVLLATGARMLSPSEAGGWDGPGAASLLELEAKLRAGSLNATQVVMVLCAGARCDQRPYCARFCCMAALKNALLLRKQKPECSVTMLYRDLSVNCMNATDIWNALQEGVRFVRYDPAVQPRLGEGGAVSFRCAGGEDGTIPCDLAVPVTPLVPHDETRRLAKMLAMPVDAHGFVVERQVKVKPEWPIVPGAAVIGLAHWPCSAPEAARQAREAAARIIRWFDETTDAPEAVIAAVDIQKCIGCGLCMDVCPFNAAGMTAVDNEQKAFISTAACRGCGICSAGCPALAITLLNHTDEQIRSQIRALGAGL